LPRVLFIALLARIALDGGADAGTAPTQDVHTFLSEQVAAWNKGDLEAFTSSYAEDATFNSPTGVTKGRDQVLARYKKRYPDKAAMGTLSFELLETRAQSSAVSIAAKWTLTYPNKPAASGHTLLVIHPRGTSWMIVQDASM
jgi:uncharacterized protein (TIGR02246 family)